MKETPAYTSESIIAHLADLRRASTVLYQGGMFTQGDHARIMLKIARYEDRLLRANRAALEKVSA